MVMWTDIVTSTSTGTGTTNTTLNGGTPYTTSNLAGCLLEVAPVQAATGAYTAAESSLQRFTATSTSIGALSPKAIAMTPTHGGLGTFAGTQVAIIKSYKWNTPLPNSNIPITFSGQAYVANTAAFRVGATLTFTSEQPVEKEVFYDSVANETSAGTAAAEVALETITVNGATALAGVYAHFGVGTVTASESEIGSLRVFSSDLTPIQQVQAFWQPVGAGLGTAVQMLQPDSKFYPQFMGIRPTATLAGYNTLAEAQTSAPNVVWGCAYLR